MTPDPAGQLPPRSLRHRIERGFGAWGRGVAGHARLAILLCALVAAAFGSFLPNLRSDNTMESFLREGDASLARYDEFRDRFGRDDRIVLGVDPPEVFDLAFLERLRALHEDLEAELPYVQEVTSLWNARSTLGRGDELVVGELLADWPNGEENLAHLRRRVFDTPLYRNLLISADGGFTTVVIEPDTYSSVSDSGADLGGFGDARPGSGREKPAYLSDPEARKLVHALRAVLERHRAPDFPIYALGGPLMNVTLNERIEHDVAVFMSLSVLVIAAILAVLFRRASGVLLPLLVVIVTLMCTLGAMALIDIPFSVTLQILPAFLVAVGVCDSVHLLVLFYRRLAAGETRADAIAFSLGHSGLPILMTSLTTAGGLLSFLFADLRPVYHLGIAASFGVMLAWAFNVTLLPALLAVLPIKPRSRAEALAGGRLADRVLVRIGDAASRRPWTVVAATALILAVGLVGAARVRFGHDAMRWFPADDPLRVASDVIDKRLGGVTTLEFEIDSGRDFGLHDPGVLRRLDAAAEWVRGYQMDSLRVASAISIVDIVKETHRALNENRQSHYAIPAQRPLVAQEMLLFEQSGSDDLQDVTDGSFRLARLTLRVPWVDAMVYPEFIWGISERFRGILGPELPFTVTGMAELLTRAFRALILSLGRSYAVALAVIVPLMMFLIGSVSRGLVAMIPNLIPVFLTLGLMGWLGIPLDASTLLIGAIVIGLAVDDTIHFVHKFNRYLEDLGDPRAAVRETLLTTGSALLFTSLALGAGFAVLLLAYMENSWEFGMLCLFAISTAFAADVVLGPALMVLVTRRRAGETPAAAELPSARS